MATTGWLSAYLSIFTNYIMYIVHDESAFISRTTELCVIKLFENVLKTNLIFSKALAAKYFNVVWRDSISDATQM